MAERKIKTASGFECAINEENLQDMRLIDALVSMEDTGLDAGSRIVSMIRVLRLMLGEEQKDAYYNYLVKKKGKADPQTVGEDLKVIINSLNEDKKK